jgi:glycosyltransferase involved in cell wall biosynthesis
VLGRLTDGYIANSEATADGLRRVGAAAAKIVVVRNGTVVPPRLSPEERAQLRASVGAAEDASLVVMVARIDPGYKDHETFLRTVAELPGITAAVVGDGPGRAAAESTAAGLGIADRVSFTGFRRDARALAAASDVCVLLTYSEGLSNSVLEAMAAGIPVIATDIPANRELIRDGVDGVLVPVRDVSAAAAALGRLVAHPADAARLGAAARERVAADFSPEAQAARTMEVYERLVAARRR